MLKLCNFLILFFFTILNSNSYTNENKILVKVGNEIITSYDLENEIRTNLILSKKIINQENINLVKDISVKNLINNTIKMQEIEKYKIKDFDEMQYNNYLENITKEIINEGQSIKSFFEENQINYEKFTNKIKNELKWNTLIYSLYQNQTNINPIEIENELNESLKNLSNTRKYEISEIQIDANNYDEEKYKLISQFIDKEGFASAALKFSVSETKNNGGNLGIFEENQLNKEILNYIQRIKENEYTAPIKTENFITILYLNKIIIDKKFIDEDKERDKIVKLKKQEKLRLFSSSHFSNLEASTLIKFQ